MPAPQMGIQALGVVTIMRAAALQNQPQDCRFCFGHVMVAPRMKRPLVRPLLCCKIFDAFTNARTTLRRTFCWLAFGTVFASGAAGAAENWPQFRGPDGDGHSDAK